MASLLRLLNCATLPWTSEEAFDRLEVEGSWRSERKSEGSEGECGSAGGCCRFTRSGEMGKSGAPGEAGILNTGSMHVGAILFKVKLPSTAINEHRNCSDSSVQ